MMPAPSDPRLATGLADLRVQLLDAVVNVAHATAVLAAARHGPYAAADDGCAADLQAAHAALTRAGAQLLAQADALDVTTPVVTPSAHRINAR